MTHADRLLGICSGAHSQPSRLTARGGWALLGALLIACVGCRIREDVPPAPSASASLAPSSAPSPSALAIRDAASEAAPEVPDAEPPPEGSEALAFAGLGTDGEADATLHDAIRAALASLSTDQRAGSAAVAGVVVLEDDPKLNAGTGGNLRVDGRTAEADAAVMVLDADGESHFAAVAAIEGVKNPILVAEKLLGGPTPVLSGFWARDFASRVGITAEPISQDAQVSSYRAAMSAALADSGAPWHRLPWATYVDPALRDGGAPLPRDAGPPDAGARDAAQDGAAQDAGSQEKPLDGSTSSDATAPVNSATPGSSAGVAPAPSAGPTAKPPKPPTPPSPKPRAPKPPPTPTPAKPSPSASPTPAPAPSDTVAVLIRDANDRFAVAASSGGPPLALPGRIGDVPVYGAGIFVGPHGAVAVTGRGELIVELGLARKIYERLALTRSARIAATWGVKQVPKEEPVGIAVLGKRDAHVARTAALAWLGWRDGKWKAPEDAP